MRNAFMIAGIFAAATALGSTGALAKKPNGMHGNKDGLHSLARADKVAGTHGLKGRNVARTRGANATGFCPPGQQKKPGLGSRFAC